MMSLLAAVAFGIGGYGLRMIQDETRLPEQIAVAESEMMAEHVKDHNLAVWRGRFRSGEVARCDVIELVKDATPVPEIDSGVFPSADRTELWTVQSNDLRDNKAVVRDSDGRDWTIHYYTDVWPFDRMVRWANRSGNCTQS